MKVETVSNSLASPGTPCRQVVPDEAHKRAMKGMKIEYGAKLGDMSPTIPKKG